MDITIINDMSSLRYLARFGSACIRRLWRTIVSVGVFGFARWTSGRVIMNGIRHTLCGIASRSSTPPRVSGTAGNCQSGQDQYIELIKAVMRERGITQSDVARGTSLDQSSISRYCSKKRPLDLEVLTRIMIFLEIDRVRAVFAVEHFYDFTRYFERGLMIACDIACALPDELRAVPGYDRLTPVPAVIKALGEDAVRRLANKDTRIALLKTRQMSAKTNK
jgi:transcriptional regulator with XRE-family HTH domain